MLSSLLQPMRSRPSSQHSTFSSQNTYRTSSVAARGSTAEERGLLAADDESAYRDNDGYRAGEEEDDGEDGEDDEDGLEGSGLTPLLPIFEAAKLGETLSSSTHIGGLQPIDILQTHFRCTPLPTRFVCWLPPDAKPRSPGTKSGLRKSRSSLSSLYSNRYWPLISQRRRSMP